MPGRNCVTFPRKRADLRRPPRGVAGGHGWRVCPVSGMSGCPPQLGPGTGRRRRGRDTDAMRRPSWAYYSEVERPQRVLVPDEQHCHSVIPAHAFALISHVCASQQSRRTTGAHRRTSTPRWPSAGPNATHCAVAQGGNHWARWPMGHDRTVAPVRTSKGVIRTGGGRNEPPLTAECRNCGLARRRFPC